MNESFLFNLITAAKREIEYKIELIKNMPESAIIPGLDDGKIIGYSRSLELINMALGLYQIKEDGKSNETEK